MSDILGRLTERLHGTGARVDHIEPDLRDAADEIERLRRWKFEAIAVLEAWESVWIAAGRPGPLGSSKAAAVRDLVEQRIRRVSL